MIINGSGQGQPAERFVLLWSNEDTNSAFAEQTIELDMMSYSMFLILTKCSITDYGYDNDLIMNIADRRTWTIGASYLRTDNTGVSVNSTRAVTVSETGITFAKGQGTLKDSKGSSSAISSNDYAIPYRIYAMY